MSAVERAFMALAIDSDSAERAAARADAVIGRTLGRSEGGTVLPACECHARLERVVDDPQLLQIAALRLSVGLPW